MQSRMLVLVGVGGACLAAAGTGAWLATRQPAAPASAAVATVTQAGPGAPAQAGQPVAANTEGDLTSASAAPTAAGAAGSAGAGGAAAPAVGAEGRTSASQAQSRPAAVASPRPRPAASVPGARERPATTVARAERSEPASREAGPASGSWRTEPVSPAGEPVVSPPAAEVASAREPAPAAGRVEAPAPQPDFRELVIPADAVMGLRLETTVSSEGSHVEDRVEAAVTRDVRADGRVAIPSGSRAEGSVTLVERGGRFKERARVGVRFHTLVLADGTRLPVQTDAVFREGVSPANSSTAKVGGAAVGGAILGAILGGGKGAAIGGSIGAAGGTAAVMAGSRSEAVLPAGTTVTVRLTAPVTVTVER